MKKLLAKWLPIALLVLVMAISLAACGQTPADTTAPDTPLPEATTPEETTPEVTTPEDTDPADTDPVETLPEETLPEETLPSETQPAETDPAETEPGETEPADTTPTGGDHRHQFTTTQSFPNCTTSGFTYYRCACGEMYELESEPALGHAPVLIDTLLPTCAVAGYETYECVSCGAIERRPIPQTPHTFTVSAAVFPTSALRTGNAFELLACSACDKMIKVDANHASGHFFESQEDGTALCACGAVGVTTPAQLGSMDFVSGTQGKNIVVSNGVKVADGKWVVSQSTQQAFLHYDKNPALAQALAGTDAEGNTVLELSLAFDLTYTGTYRKNLNFINLLGPNGFIFQLNLGSDVDGHLTLHDGVGSNAIALTADETYLVKLILMPKANLVRVTVEGGDLEEPATVFAKTTKDPLSAGTQIGLSRPEFACGENEDYAIYVDNMALDLVTMLFDPTSTEGVMYCDHKFTTESVVDIEHLAEDQWLRSTCSVCNRYFEAQDCELVGEHIFTKEPTDLTPSTCVTAGTATYACLICGEEISEPLALSDHTFTVSTAVFESASLYKSNGYELLGCRDCKEMILAVANHESGHCFTEQADGNYLCACGAKALGSKTTVGTMDFSTNRFGTGISFDTTLTVTDGKWMISDSWRQHFLHYAANPDLSKALTGVNADGTPIESFAITFELTYTGAYNKNLNFINILGDTDFLASIYFGTDAEGHLALYDGAKGEKTILTAGETYKVSFILLPATNSLKATVEGGDLAEKVTLYEKKASQSLATSKQIGLGRPNSAFACGEGEDYTIVVDNMAFVSTVLSFDESTADDSNLCTHDLVAAEDGFACLVCERHLERADCETAGHLLLAAATETKPSTCVTAGYEKHLCLLCGETVSVDLPLGDHDIPTVPTSAQASTCTTPGYNKYKCNNCDHTVTEDLPLLPHTFNVSTGVVTAKNDPVGEGYELFGCSCGKAGLKKVIANHESGHFLVDGTCACGAVFKTESSQETLGAFDFSNTTGTGSIVFTGFPDISNGEWPVTVAWRQNFVRLDQNATLKQALTGTDASGATVDAVTVSFKLKYTGTYSNNLNFLNFYNDSDSNFAAGIWFGNDGNGKLALYDGASGTKTALTAGQTYTVKFIMYPANNGFKATVEGGDLSGVTTILEKVYNLALADGTQITFSRKQFKCTDGSHTITVDDLTFVCDKTTSSVDTSAVNTDHYCEHSFTKTAIVNDKILEADKWFDYTCSKCGGSYSAQEAKHIVIGQLDYTDKTSLWNPVFRIQKITEAMLVDGKFKVSTTDGMHLATAADNAHVAALFDGVDEDGSRISRITLSYDFSYTGKLSFSAANSGNNYVFVNLMHNANGGDLGFAVELRATEDGKAVVNGKNSPDKKLVLDPGKDYTFRIHLDPGTKRISCTVSGADMSETELFSLTSTASFTNFLQFAFSRATYNATKNGNGFELFFDNISIAYDKVAK